MSDLPLYNFLRKKLGEQETEELIRSVKSEIKSEMDSRSTIFMTKEDKIDLIDHINKSKTETIIWIVSIGILQFLLMLVTKFFL